MIHDMLLIENPDLLVRPRRRDGTSEHRLPVTEADLTRFTSDGGGEVLGHKLLHAVDVVELTWTSTIPEETPQALYGADAVPLGLLRDRVRRRRRVAANPGHGYSDGGGGGDSRAASEAAGAAAARPRTGRPRTARRGVRRSSTTTTTRSSCWRRSASTATT